MYSHDYKVDLTVLNSLVKELNNMVAELEKVKGDKAMADADYVVELSKAVGVATGVSYEANALVGDILKLVKMNSVPQGNPEDILSTLLGKFPPKN